MEDRILDAALNVASAAEVYSESVIAMTVAFEANRCHAIENKITRGLGLRVIWNGKIGFSSTTNPERIGELVEAAVTTARFGQPAGFELPPDQVLPQPLIARSRISLLPAERMKLVGDHVIELCQEKIPDMKVDLFFQRVFSSVRLVNSNGFEATYEKANYSLDFTGLRIIDSSLVWISDFLNLSKDGVLDAEALVKRVADQSRQAQRAAKLTTKSYPCIFTYAAPLALLSAIAEGVNGKNLEKGISPLIGKETAKLLDEKLTIWDDGLKPFSFGSAPFDGEGIPRQKTPLFERGVFRNFLLDLKTAAATQRKSTGSGGRSYASVPAPALSNIVVRPGVMNLERAISGMGEGLVIYSTVGAGQSNLLAGDFSLGMGLGFKVEKGEIVGRVKNAMVAGNIYEIGRELVGIGDTPHDFGDASVPFLYFPGLNVAAT